MTNTTRREPLIVRKFCERVEEEIRKTVETKEAKSSALHSTRSFFQKLQKQSKIVFRRTDRSNVTLFHIDNPENHIKTSTTYMSRTNAYVEIATSPPKGIIERKGKFLRNLVARKRMPKYILNRLLSALTESELLHLYYNPRDHKMDESHRSIVDGMKSPVWNLSIIDLKRDTGGRNTYNFLTERAEELQFSAFERGRQGTQIYVRMKKFPILSKLTSAKQSLKNRQLLLK